MSNVEAWSRVGGVAIAALALTVLLMTGPRMLGLAAGPEAEIITEVKRLERQGLHLPLPGVSTPLTGREAVFDRITVRVEPGAQRAEALATLDFTGALGDTDISSLGVEQVPFTLRDHNWVPEGSVAPRLAAVVSALEARRRAIDSGDMEALDHLTAPQAGDAGTAPEADGGSVGVGELKRETLLALKRRRYRAEAWFIRLERDEALVTEHWHLEGDLPSRPVDQQGESRMILLRHGEEFLFSSALR